MPTQLATLITQGVFASRPAASAAVQYYATDTKVMYWSNGSSWSAQPFAMSGADLTDNTVVAAKLSATATDKVFGRSTAGAGAGEEITLTAAGRALIDDANAAAQLATLGAAAASHVHAGADITSGTVADARIDAAIARDAEILATKLDDFTAPDDNTDLNVSITKHGLTPKLPNDATKYLDGTGAYTVPPAASGMTDPMTTRGDIIIRNAANATARLGRGTAGQVFTSDGTDVAWVSHELAYNEVTSPVTVSATTEAGSTTIVTASSVTYDGNPVLIECEFPYVQVPVSDNLLLVLFDDTAGASIGKLGQYTNPDPTNVMRFSAHCSRRLTPAAGARVYSIRGFRVTANGTIGVGAGGVGNLMPGFIRITKI